MSSPLRCPYTIKLLDSTKNNSIYLIRENDKFGEYPNIYVKKYFHNASREASVIILSDTGTGLNSMNDRQTIYLGHSSTDPSHKESISWNIASFLESTLNPRHAAPYIVLTTHCHYDHILGITSLQEAKADVTVLASSHSKEYLTPYCNLQKHSLCEQLKLRAPKYDGRWIEDAQKITYTDKTSGDRQQSSITVIHTPGHTPDSLSWYDHDFYTLCVGDMFYEQESDETRSGSGGQWSKEPPQPIIFVRDSSVVDWNASMHRVLDFVRYENRRLETLLSETRQPPRYRQDGHGAACEYTETLHAGDWSLITTAPIRRRVALCAAHVTIATDAEFALLDMLAFMLRIQLDQAPKRRIEKIGDNDDWWLWEDSMSHNASPLQKEAQASRYSVKAPWSVIHPGSSKGNPESSALTTRPFDTDFRSVIRHMATPNMMLTKRPCLKASVSASVSHDSATADRPSSNTGCMARKE